MAQPKYHYNGFSGLEAIAEHAGLSVWTLKHRILRYGCSLEEAIKAGPSGRVDYKYEGIHGLTNIAEKYDMKVSTLKARLERGMTIEKAVTTPLQRMNVFRGGRKKKPTQKASGIKYPVDLNPLWKLALGIGDRA